MANNLQGDEPVEKLMMNSVEEKADPIIMNSNVSNALSDAKETEK